MSTLTYWDLTLHFIINQICHLHIIFVYYYNFYLNIYFNLNLQNLSQYSLAVLLEGIFLSLFFVQILNISCIPFISPKILLQNTVAKH